MQATQSLPSTHTISKTVDISKDRRLVIVLNLVGVLLMIGAGYLFLLLIAVLRPGDAFSQAGMVFSNSLQTIWVIIAVLALTAFFVVVHEAVHGIFFWWFTRSRPKFAFRWTHAYAAAPDWFLPRNAYLITTLAPLVVISLAGIASMPWVPAAWLLPLWFILTSNAAGAVGDLMVALWLLRQPPDCLANDRGDAVTLYNQPHG